MLLYDHVQGQTAPVPIGVSAPPARFRDFGVATKHRELSLRRLFEVDALVSQDAPSCSLSVAFEGVHWYVLTARKPSILFVLVLTLCCRFVLCTEPNHGVVLETMQDLYQSRLDRSQGAEKA